MIYLVLISFSYKITKAGKFLTNLICNFVWFENQIITNSLFGNKSNPYKNNSNFVRSVTELHFAFF